MLDFVLHTFLDIWYCLLWIIEGLNNLINSIFSPLTWIFNFIKGFLVGIAKSPAEIEVPAFPDFVISALDTIPHFSILITGISVCIGILFLAFIFKKIIHI